ncbi:unnamed protein product [Cylicostephanus goldi]|uniref:Uncharacterized protein n=1 Tax=Cylicostephanus goldi TaxID=71465 RepID=A0A3P6SB18_CYLGO|nr:unnamed protein product [Cylicostephanus goldi]
MYDADLGRNQSFDEFCRGFCMANEPVRQYFVSIDIPTFLLPIFKISIGSFFQNGMRILAANTSFELDNRIDLAYPTSEMFYKAFSLLPNFFGIELEEDGRTLKSVGLIALIFRAEKHRSWTTTMVKEWELQVQTYFEKLVSNLKIFAFDRRLYFHAIFFYGFRSSCFFFKLQSFLLPYFHSN